LVLISGFFGIIVAVAFGLMAFLAPTGIATLAISSKLQLQSIVVGMLEIVWLIPYLKAVNHAGAVKAAPLFQVIPVISLVLGLTFFGEVPPVIQIIGAGIIIAGGILLDLTNVEGSWCVDKKTIRLMLLASTIIAGTTFVFKDTAHEGNFIATAFYTGIGEAIMSCFIFLVYTPYRKQFLVYCKEADKAGLMVQLTNETIDAMAVMTSFKAVTLGPSVMAVTAMNAWQPVFILIIGWILAKRGSKAHVALLEANKLKQTAWAIGLLAVGTVLIALK
jgi:uncharacterized membrane protein